LSLQVNVHEKIHKFDFLGDQNAWVPVKMTAIVFGLLDWQLTCTY